MFQRCVTVFALQEIGSGTKLRNKRSRESKTDPTVSFINRPLQIGYLLNGVHEFVLGPYTQNQDLGLPQILYETEFYVVDLETS